MIPKFKEILAMRMKIIYNFYIYLVPGNNIK